MYQNTVEIRRHDIEAVLMSEGDYDYVLPRVLPFFSVRNKQGGMPTILSTDDQVLNIRRSPLTSHQRVQGEVDRVTFDCEELSIEEPFSIEDGDAIGFDMVEMAVGKRLCNITKRANDAALASALFNPANFNTTAATGNWGDSRGTDPINDVEIAKEEVYKGIAEEPNAMLISRAVQLALSRDPVIRARANTIGGYLGDKRAYKGRISAEVLSEIFELEVIIAGGLKNTANKGQTPVRDYVWSDDFALVFRKATEYLDMMTPQLGRTFVWDAGVSVEEEHGEVDQMHGLVIEGYREPEISADVLRAKTYQDSKVLKSSAGHLLTGLAT